jgi:beta-glucosidase
VEGGNEQNQWHDWEMAGRIKSGHACRAACDWWNNAERDFDLAQELGLNSLRLSVEWSRIEPEAGRWDPAALQRYRQMLQALHARGIRPMVCLHHFSHPRWFEQQGGFLHPQAPQLFERFTRHVVEALGDLCQDWLTFNEPNVYSAFGYVVGEFPPGRRGRLDLALRVISAQARCHLLAYRVIHELQPQAQVGWAQHFAVFQPVGSGIDRWIASLLHQIFNESFLQLIEHGRLKFPFSLLDGKTNEVQGACDFVGLNVYSRFHVTMDLSLPAQLFGHIFVPSHVPQGDSGVERPYGEAFPQAIRIAVERASRLGKPIYILENGVPDAEDRIRPWLILEVVKELHCLIQEGHDVRGYFHWTLTDNFEWTEGWTLRFGLAALDQETQVRTLRKSGNLYREIIRNHGLTPEIVGKYQP